MTEQKRPVLTLKRKTEGETPTRSRKTIINVTTPPKWKVKKQKLAEKEKGVLFGGRLASYKYYDMDKVIEAALEAVSKEFEGE